MSNVKLKCSHCTELLPATATVFRKKKKLEAALEGKATAFCGKACAAGYAHANRSPEVKRKRLESTRKSRGIEPRSCQVCGNEFFSKKKKFCSPACWYDYAKVRDPGETAAIYEKRARTNALKSQKQLDEERKRRLDNLPVNVGGEVLRQWKLRLKRTAAQSGEQALRAKRQWATVTYEEKKAFYQKRTDNWYARPEEERKVIAKKISEAQRKRTPERVAAIAKRTHLTKKANGTYAKSRPELEIFTKLQSLLGLEVQHLHCEHPKYPWEADYFDPKSGTIFEYQGFPSHGPEPFNVANPEHAELLGKLKNSPGWLPRLTTKIWAKSDVLKRETARNNQIPFVEWFNKEQFTAWFDQSLADRLGADKHKDGCFKIRDRYLLAHDSKWLPKFAGKNLVVFYPWDDLTKIIRQHKSKNQTYYARKLDVVEIPRKISDKFCNMYHLQGSCRGTQLAVGLVDRSADKPKLLGVMTFGKPRYNKNYDYELLRLCFRANIVGGSQRMFKHALGKLLNGSSVISYCDSAKFSGSIYETLGFVRQKNPKPSTHWYNQSTGQRVSDNLLRQHGFDRLVGANLGLTYGKGTNNEELMRKHGFKAIQDQGQVTYLYKGTQ